MRRYWSFAVALVLHAGNALAEGTALDRFDPAERGSRFFSADSLTLSADRPWSAGVTIDVAHEPLVVLDARFNLVSANPAFYRLFKVSPSETVGERLHELGNRQWDIPPLRKLLTNVLLKRNSFENFVVEHDFPKIGRKKMLLNGSVLEHETDKLILLAIEEEPA